jgi:Rieske Fe-S protein
MSRARDAICARTNCTIAYTAFHLTLDCRCHGSTYEMDGSAFSVSSDERDLTVALS